MIGKALAQLAGDAACNLRDFERVCQARPVKVAVAQIQNLRLALQSAERGRVDDAGIINIPVIASIFTLWIPALAAR